MAVVTEMKDTHHVAVAAAYNVRWVSQAIDVVDVVEVVHSK